MADAHPNMLVEFAPGSQSWVANPTRDGSWSVTRTACCPAATRRQTEGVPIYLRFLESDDEYFDPAGGHHRQGMWMIYGVFLPRGARKIYHANAERLSSTWSDERPVRNDLRTAAERGQSY